jgi:hypothetical protein
MKKSIIVFAVMFAFAFTLWKCVTPSHSVALTGLPQDVCQTCTLNVDTFKTWFKGGQINSDSIVTPANSAVFPNQNNCNFYQWSERMFLWLTSPVKNRYILTDTGFFNVTPPDAKGYRQLIPHTPGTPLMMTSHLLKVGPDKLPVLKDNKGKLYEIEKPSHNAKDVVKDITGNTVEVANIKTGANNAFTFIDKAGKTITHPEAIVQHKASHLPIVHMFMMGKKPVFLDAAGNIVESEEGQATGDALMAQTKSLVYYMTLVNDVYVQYLNLAKQPGSPYHAQFPTTPPQRHAVVAYAQKQGIILPDSNALAIEVKSSWVEASTLAADSSNYIIVSAVIPTYTNVNTADTMWVPNGGTKLARMALVGMHIVGGVTGHPEEVWATFEHKKNTPNAAYSYLNTAKDTIHVPQDGGTGWLFTNNPADTTPNTSHITTADPRISNGPNTDTLFAQVGKTISPSNTQRSMPWGSAAGSLVNPEDGSSAASNSEIISINNSIMSMLPANDMRKNYLFIGATWTAKGGAPSGNSYSGVDTAGVTIGTSVLANSTMETYIQTNATSCFTCHSSGSGAASLLPDTLSHIFKHILPYAVVFKPLKKH